MSLRRHGSRQPLGRKISVLERADRRNTPIPAADSLMIQGPNGYILMQVEAQDDDVVGGGGGEVGVVIEKITAAAAGGFPFTPGVGVVALGSWSGAVGGPIEASGRTADAYNSLPEEIPVGTRVQLKPALGVLWADVAPCP